MSSKIQEIVEYYHTCFSIPQTAKHFDETKQYITKILKNIGITLLSRPEANRQNAINRHKDTIDTKTCRRCKVNKDRGNFYKSTRSKDGYKFYCKQCANKLWMLTKYNLTEEQYNILARLQSYKCSICKTPFNEIGRLCVDHIKNTKIVRGLICEPCNLMLGKANHDPETLRNGADYLENPPGNILYP